jgi:hypothetical protein
MLCQRTEVHVFQVAEHGDEAAQAAAQRVELPHDERVAVVEFLQTAEKGRALESWPLIGRRP